MKTPFNKAVADMIVEMVANNNSLVSICQLEYMPKFNDVLEWLHDDSPQCMAFRRAYDFAEECRAQYLFEQIIEIADDSSEDEIEVERRDGSTYIKENREFVNRSRLKVQARLDVIAKMKPKKYGRKAEEAIGDGKDKLKELFAILAQGPAN